MRCEESQKRVLHQVDGTDRGDPLEGREVRSQSFDGDAGGRHLAVGAAARGGERVVHEGHHVGVLVGVDAQVAALARERLEEALDLRVELARELLAHPVAVERPDRRGQKVAGERMAERAALVHEKGHVAGLR